MVRPQNLWATKGQVSTLFTAKLSRNRSLSQSTFLRCYRCANSNNYLYMLLTATTSSRNASHLGVLASSHHRAPSKGILYPQHPMPSHFGCLPGIVSSFHRPALPGASNSNNIKKTNACLSCPPLPVQTSVLSNAKQHKDEGALVNAPWGGGCERTPYERGIHPCS
jgi:hypothetical protein